MRQSKDRDAGSMQGMANERPFNQVEQLEDRVEQLEEQKIALEEELLRLYRKLDREGHL